jgi:hypothetical protein
MDLYQFVLLQFNIIVVKTFNNSADNIFSYGGFQTQKKFDAILAVLRNQKLLYIKNKKKKFLRNISHSVATINCYNRSKRIFCLLPIFSYLHRLIVSLVSNNLLFSFYLWDNIFDSTFFKRDNFKRTQILVFITYGLIFFRYSLEYGRAFNYLKIVSFNSRRLYFTHKAFKRYFNKSIGKSTKIYFFNTTFGLITHLQLIRLKCGGNIVLVCE